MVPLLELLLVEDLNCEHRRVGYRDVKAVVPVRVESLFDDAGRVRLLAIYGDDGEGVGETEDVPLL